MSIKLTFPTATCPNYAIWLLFFFLFNCTILLIFLISFLICFLNHKIQTNQRKTIVLSSPSPTETQSLSLSLWTKWLPPPLSQTTSLETNMCTSPSSPSKPNATRRWSSSCKSWSSATHLAVNSTLRNATSSLSLTKTWSAHFVLPGGLCLRLSKRRKAERTRIMLCLLRNIDLKSRASYLMFVLVFWGCWTRISYHLLLRVNPRSFIWRWKGIIIGIWLSLRLVMRERLLLKILCCLTRLLRYQY